MSSPRIMETSSGHLPNMYADTSLPGDAEYTAGKLEKLRDEYLAREAARLNAAADEGKTKQLRKESDEAVQEVIDRDKHAETLLDMARTD